MPFTAYTVAQDRNMLKMSSELQAVKWHKFLIFFWMIGAIYVHLQEMLWKYFQTPDQKSQILKC